LHSRLPSLLLIGLLFSSFILFSPNVHSVTVEEVYTNAFDSAYVAWIEVGDSPYLQNSSADYIYRLTSKTLTHKEGRWTFPGSAGSGTINSVKLRFMTYRTKLDGESCVKVYVWDGASWVLAGNLNLFSLSYAWEEIDVSSILNTWAKINGAKVYLEATKYLSIQDTLYIELLTRKVDYTSTPVGEWHDVSTWTASLVTRTWSSGTSWLFDFGTSSWKDVATWTSQALTRQWNTVGTWLFQLNTMGWHSIDWIFALSTSGWHSVYWVFTLGEESNIPVLFVGLAFLGSLALIVFGWRLKKRRM
jgi:hypothetical protein